MGELKPFFSIIVVCLNPGEKLKCTLDSIVMQKYEDFEVIIKDGISADGAAEKYVAAQNDTRIKLFMEPDLGIYDAMNQALEKASGAFIYFLNCGDLFYDKDVLTKVRNEIAKSNQAGIFYGNVFEVLTGQEVLSNPCIDRFACYRHLPCHQACFYRKELLSKHPFIIEYKVRADYEQFLWCFLKAEAAAHYMPLMIACYEGAGFSETKANRKISMLEHQEIVRTYMSKREVLKYRLILCLTLSPLRTKLARNKYTSGIYNQFKKMLYSLTSAKFT